MHVDASATQMEGDGSIPHGEGVVAAGKLADEHGELDDGCRTI